MNIIVEIGSDEQKKMIAQELEIIKTLSNQITPLTPVTTLIVPADFDRKINELLKTTTYKSVRTNQLCVAKVITVDTETFLIFSPHLYTAMCDSVTRVQFYIHEFLHVLHKTHFPTLNRNSLSISEYEYLSILYILFDEYLVDRKCLYIIEKIFPDPAPKHSWRQARYVKELIRPIIECTQYETICLEINQFRIHGIPRRFLNNIGSHYDEISKALIHSYAHIDHNDRFQRFLPFVLKSKFVNYKSEALINFCRRKAQENSYDLTDGLGVISDFMENFGIRYTTVKEWLYCEVLDI